VIIAKIFKENFAVCNIGLIPADRRLTALSSQICDTTIEVLSDRLFDELLCYLLFVRDRKNFPIVMMEGNSFEFISTTYNDLVFVLNTLPSDYRYEVSGDVMIVDDPLPRWAIH
jgi:hypothetical protein